MKRLLCKFRPHTIRFTLEGAECPRCHITCTLEEIARELGIDEAKEWAAWVRGMRDA